MTAAVFVDAAVAVAVAAAAIAAVAVVAVAAVAVAAAASTTARKISHPVSASSTQVRRECRPGIF